MKECKQNKVKKISTCLSLILDVVKHKNVFI